MTFKYNNVFVKNTSTVAGKIEKQGPLKAFFDKTYDDYYFEEKSLELAEVKLLKDSIDILLEKSNIRKEDIDLAIAGDLLNQVTASYYGFNEYNIPFLGVYSACATTMESIIIGSSLIDAKRVKNVICSTSSHNLTSEKQFRNPIEYGAPKPQTASFTATGGASILLSNEKSNIKVESSTIGRIVDMNQTDVNDMGSAMAPAAGDTIYRHLKDMKRDADYYDLILTGDLGLFGKSILQEYMKKEYKIDLKENYNDCGVLLYDTHNQKEITAGGSGPVCSALVNYGYIYDLMKQKKINRVLLVTTGALFSPTFAFQKQPILGIAHAVSLEVVS
jgi:stage V sporulation protein AD